MFFGVKEVNGEGGNERMIELANERTSLSGSHTSVFFIIFVQREQQEQQEHDRLNQTKRNHIHTHTHTHTHTRDVVDATGEPLSHCVC